MSRTSPLVPIFVTVALLLSVAIAFTSLFVAVTAQDTDPLPDDATLLKMKVKDLKAFLEKKGSDAACLACTSKQEYISRIRETIDWPDVTPEPTPAADEPSMEDLKRMFTEGQNDERFIELKKKLQEAGLDTSKIFTASGIDRDEVLKEKAKWEKRREDINAEDADSAEGDTDASDETESKTDL